ncbi:MAG TPA: thiamine pyrophosphate-dependent dehydrogenase E1 component subunit alpha [Jatrophihabitans sp.]|nr:thiamine pyrophosphate-dependent dehydrogenase E1 component subunit alpha [Jatrophihabitans sp.]
MTAIGVLSGVAAEPGLALRERHCRALQDLDLYEAMLAIRVFEERVRELRLDGDVVGSVHLEIGQEAIPVGALLALRPGDPVFSTYRGHGWALACGSPFAAVFGELLGRETGVNGGRGGSAYFSDVAHGFYGENSIVGAGAPIACGAALAAKRAKSGAAVLTVFGDGAMNQGSVSEALNFAAALKLPVIFLCENNRYSELTLLADVVPSDQLYERGGPYRIPGVRIDGNDARTVAAAVAEAADRARAGDGPSLIEAMTERIAGHYIGDHEQYRGPGELERICADEPLVRLARNLPTADLREVQGRVAHLMRRASTSALEADLADASAVRDHLYADGALYA